MKKQHQKPEFQVIIQSEANSKFFVASGNNVINSTNDINAASSYEVGTLSGSWE